MAAGPHTSAVPPMGRIDASEAITPNTTGEGMRVMAKATPTKKTLGQRGHPRTENGGAGHGRHLGDQGFLVVLAQGQKLDESIGSFVSSPQCKEQDEEHEQHPRAGAEDTPQDVLPLCDDDARYLRHVLAEVGEDALERNGKMSVQPVRKIAG